MLVKMFTNYNNSKGTNQVIGKWSYIYIGNIMLVKMLGAVTAALPKITYQTIDIWSIIIYICNILSVKMATALTAGVPKTTDQTIAKWSCFYNGDNMLVKMPTTVTAATHALPSLGNTTSNTKKSYLLLQFPRNPKQVWPLSLLWAF